MPRISKRLIYRARLINPVLPLLLRPCRGLRSAKNELRWLREHIDDTLPDAEHHRQRERLWQLCRIRAVGTPLQYILGSQPFGDLEILCRPQVLTPRVETESYTLHLSRVIKQNLRLLHGAAHNEPADDKPAQHKSTRPPLRILDLCSGTGCIGLLLYSSLRRIIGPMYVRGIDLSPHALRLAQKNLRHNIDKGHLDVGAEQDISFQYGDILSDELGRLDEFDVLVSNPPYISTSGFWRHTDRSVRSFEPKMALVPSDSPAAVSQTGVDSSGDVFYKRLLEIGEHTRAKLFVAEVDDMAQIERILAEQKALSASDYWSAFAVWRDNVGWDTNKVACIQVHGQELRDVGTGNARAVVFVRRGLAFE